MRATRARSPLLGSLPLTILGDSFRATGNADVGVFGIVPTNALIVGEGVSEGGQKTGRVVMYPASGSR
jgi:hypothetical protein